LSSPRRRPCGKKARDIEEVVGDRRLVVGGRRRRRSSPVAIVLVVVLVLVLAVVLVLVLVLVLVVLVSETCIHNNDNNESSRAMNSRVGEDGRGHDGRRGGHRRSES